MTREEEHIENLKKLQECQKENKLDSCMKCEQFLKCDTRKEYVLSVYLSMNEDMNTGGFNF